MGAEALAARALPILERLVAFDTTSNLPNLALIAWVEAYLADLGVALRRVASADGAKASLLATIGPAVPGGVVLSGHTDVVPTLGQPWTSDPFTLTRRADRLFSRGTCDMKGFLALALAAVPDLIAAPLKKPAHLAFSYDEEIGCLGAPALIAAMTAALPRPAVIVVGEPTSMEVVSAHKGVLAALVTVGGREAHSSQPHLGVSAVMVAARLMAALVELADSFEARADPGSLFEPRGATLTIGKVSGGTAGNILARQCSFLFDLRTAPGDDPRAILAEFFALAASLDGQIKARAPDGGVSVVVTAEVPAFAARPDDPAEVLARSLAGDNGPTRAVSFAAEAGQFQAAGYPTVLIGPGSIDQAHQPDEYIDISQLERGALFMTRLVETLTRDA
ncbi:MAG TPA: acetylornithine deacetylase [Caulobacteraceae bacterium]